MSEWFENERFWEVSFDTMFPPSRFEETENEIAAILALTRAQPKAALDLCCGPGRASVALARRGVEVTGVDRSAFLLDKARARARDHGVAVEWVQDDMRRFVRPSSFDLVLSLFTSFGYFEKPEENLQVLRNARESLRPGGALVMELLGKERLARVYTPADVVEGPRGQLLFEHRRIAPGWERVENTWYFLADGRYERFELRHFVYSGAELRTLLQQAGFTSVELYGGFDGRPYTGPSRLHVVARA